MIGKNFVYCRPANEDEAVECFLRFRRTGRTVLFYGGGSEIITMSRAGSITPDAVIDLKEIGALGILTLQNARLDIGAAVTLEAIRNSGLFPLLGTAAGRIADHTNQCRITLGGNLCGTIIYRESALPLLLTDARITLYGPQGVRNARFREIFNGRMELLPGEFVVQIHVGEHYVRAPYYHIKRTFCEKIAYPAVTVAAMRVDGKLRAAFSGICRLPFRSDAIDESLNDVARPAYRRAEHIISLLPYPPLSDGEGSGEYRAHLLKTVLIQMLEGQEL